ncbi:hypothetical protein Tco_0577459 [Tanacetum coccineum]
MRRSSMDIELQVSDLKVHIYAEKVYLTDLRTALEIAIAFGWAGGKVWPALGNQLGKIIIRKMYLLMTAIKFADMKSKHTLKWCPIPIQLSTGADLTVKEVVGSNYDRNHNGVFNDVVGGSTEWKVSRRRGEGREGGKTKGSEVERTGFSKRYSSVEKLDREWCCALKLILIIVMPNYTVDEAISAIGRGKFQYLPLAYAAVGLIGRAMEDHLFGVTCRMLMGESLSLLTGIAGLASASARNFRLLVVLRTFAGIGTGGTQLISLLKDIHDLDKRHSSDLAQKAKIQWAIEGDENSKYFHGIINKKRSQLAIRGVLVDGEWIEDPPKVKNEFLKHFSNRFSMPTCQTINLDSHMFQKISIDQNADLESDVSLEEIKKVFWECGTNKSPGPDGNSSFITLIPKSLDAKMVKDFRPISLIGSFYKIVAKILSNRLCIVMPNLISDVQTTFISC